MRKCFLLLGLLSLVFLLDAVALGQTAAQTLRAEFLHGRRAMGDEDWVVASDAFMRASGACMRIHQQSPECAAFALLSLALLEVADRQDRLKAIPARIQALQARNKALEVQIDALEQRNRNLYGVGIAVLSVAVLLIVCWILDKRRNRAKSFEEKERTP